MSKNPKINRSHVGSSFDDFLKEEGIFEEVDASARARVQAIRQKKLLEGASKPTAVGANGSSMTKAVKETIITNSPTYHLRMVSHHIGQRKTKPSSRNWHPKLAE